MARGILSALVAGLCALAVPAGAHGAPPTGPDGDAFYRPPAELVPGPAGSVVWTRPAAGIAAVSGAASTTVVLYRSRALDGAPIVVSGTVVLPHGTPPPGGWPVVAWSHVTTGAADSCAPSRVTPEHPERERMTRGNAITRRMLRAGLAVVRSDYEGIGTPGPHPYLIGRSLARSTVDMVRAGREASGVLSSRYVAAGHSEGGVASLFTAQYGPSMAPELELRGAAAVAPPVASRELMDLARGVTVANPVVGELSRLGGLILHGAATTDREIAALLREGGLGPRAAGLLEHLETRCLNELGRGDSWGGLAPARIGGPRFADLRRLVGPVLDANDVRRADVGAIPIRLDAGALDLLVPLSLSHQLVRAQRARGAHVTYRQHAFGTHANITGDAVAGRGVTAWAAARLR